MFLVLDPLQLTYNRLGCPLADLSRSHPLIVGAPGRGDQELTVQHGGPI
jgi:hypothetical protein